MVFAPGAHKTAFGGQAKCEIRPVCSITSSAPFADVAMLMIHFQVKVDSIGAGDVETKLGRDRLTISLTLPQGKFACAVTYTLWPGRHSAWFSNVPLYHGRRGDQYLISFHCLSTFCLVEDPQIADLRSQRTDWEEYLYSRMCRCHPRSLTDL